jgi:beta-mannosidase
MRLPLFFLTLTFIFLFSCKDYQSERISINGDWMFSQSGDSPWKPAKVPGTVQTDLLALGEIPDPFIGSNEDSIQWVSSIDWFYKRTFSLSDSQLKKKNHVLVFKGLDTYAEVYLNGHLILNANNAFRKWEIDVADIVKKDNLIEIKLKSVDPIEEYLAGQLPYTLPESPRVFTRKAQFQYGWDWGPTIKTMGIWRDVELISYNDALLKSVFFQTKVITDSLAIMDMVLEIKSAERQTLEVQFHNRTNGNSYLTEIEVNPDQDEYPIPLSIKDPELWWAHNLGDPFLYDYQITLQRSNKRILDVQTGRFGVRSIELVTEKDSLGEGFFFKLNGIPVYAKGANYIPQNILLTKVNTSDYEKLIHDVVKSNMNMLRVWGGGIYENDIFYDLCDEKGILVWQDFMFACAMYPGDDEFLENVRQEAIDNVMRLRSHPSLALWCGNNENSEGWHRWGWKDNKTREQQRQIWNDYQKLFKDILPGIVDSLNPFVSYWETSPKYGRGDKRYRFEGDAHDWWVWHDGYPFEHYEDKVPRFMSEFGFQSYPSYEAIRYFTSSDSVWLDHPSFESHQKHSRGFSLIREYLERYFPVSDNGEDYVYLSQLLQAYGIVKGIHAHRREKPYNMGSLYWQLNDCWPVVSWSGIDGMGNWKALQYKAKSAFENLLISTKMSGDSVSISIVNDHLSAVQDTLIVTLMDFKGNILSEEKEFIKIDGSSSIIVSDFLLKEEIDTGEVLLNMEFGEAQYVHYFTEPKNLNLETGAIQLNTQKTDNGFVIELYSDLLQKDVFLDIDKKGDLSDNFFDLLPKKLKKVDFFTKNSSIEINLKTLNNINHHK